MGFMIVPWQYQIGLAWLLVGAGLGVARLRQSPQGSDLEELALVLAWSLAWPIFLPLLLVRR